ncbi:MAG: DUF456 domain-containing protein [Fibrobacter sp.]|nr:DUF456 domain-containing protein [Fibrobacter sp.]MCQ2124028.1 DUF456 domain-containing protein [Fibrobacter sp.]
MDIVILIIAIILAIVGFVGSVTPGIPGPPISWAALLLLSFYPSVTLGATLLIAMAIVAAIITVLDYVIPSISTKKFGGSKAGVWGCNIGLIVSFIGLPFGPQGLLGVIIWPFLGALIGELIMSKDLKVSARSATGAFIGFLCGTGFKLIYAAIVAFMMVYQLLIK